MKVAIILPVYNEIENIAKLEQEFLPIVKKLAQSNDVEVIFVDDGSTDGTYQAIQATFMEVDRNNLRFSIQRHPNNQGLGAALRTGFKAASADFIVTTDSDGSYSYTEIPALLSCLQNGASIVTASPYHANGKVEGVPGYRILLSRSSSLLYRILVDWRVCTYTSLFRVYRREVIDNITFECNGYRAVTEILVKGLLKGYCVVEYPATLHKRALGSSKVKLLRTILEHISFQALVLFHRLSLKPIV
jgi:dolichol-phosphate mannosyltransferase